MIVEFGSAPRTNNLKVHQILGDLSSERRRQLRALLLQGPSDVDYDPDDPSQDSGDMRIEGDIHDPHVTLFTGEYSYLITHREFAALCGALGF